MGSVSPPTYVVVGHVARDVARDGYVLGGTALYAALTACRLGVGAAMLTSIPPDLDIDVLTGIELGVVPAERATVFDNRYGPSGRVQYLRGRAADLGPDDIPASWQSAAIVHLGPIADEVDPAIAALFPRALRAATPQGWLRRWEPDGRVRPLPHAKIIPYLAGLDVVVVSEEDVADDAGAVDAYRECVRVVVLTRGARGSTVYAGKGTLHVPAYAACERDPTGAGDVFAAAFLVAYSREKDLLGAARFAAAAAALVVEGTGPAAIPTAAQVAERMAVGAS